MILKLNKTVTEEIEFDIPDYFTFDGYTMKHKDGMFTRVYNSDNYSCIGYDKNLPSSLKSVEDIKPITREQFYEAFTQAIELMTGFKYQPETEGAKNNFAQAETIEQN